MLRRGWCGVCLTSGCCVHSKLFGKKLDPHEEALQILKEQLSSARVPAAVVGMQPPLCLLCWAEPRPQSARCLTGAHGGCGCSETSPHWQIPAESTSGATGSLPASRYRRAELHWCVRAVGQLILPPRHQVWMQVLLYSILMR